MQAQPSSTTLLLGTSNEDSDETAHLASFSMVYDTTTHVIFFKFGSNITLFVIWILTITNTHLSSDWHF